MDHHTDQGPHYVDVDELYGELITGRFELEEVWQEPKTGDHWHLTFILAEVDGVFECVRMTIEPCSEDGTEVLRPLRASTVDALPFRSVLDRARRTRAKASRMVNETYRRYMEQEGPTLTPFFQQLADATADYELAAYDPGGRPETGRRHARYTDEDLERVARIYSKAVRRGIMAPTRAVEEELPCSRSQAGKLVMRCREKGLLPPWVGQPQATTNTKDGD